MFDRVDAGGEVRDARDVPRELVDRADASEAQSDRFADPVGVSHPRALGFGDDDGVQIVREVEVDPRHGREHRIRSAGGRAQSCGASLRMLSGRSRQ